MIGRPLTTESQGGEPIWWLSMNEQRARPIAAAIKRNPKGPALIVTGGAGPFL